MSEKSSPDTVPGLGFKDKDKALETLKNLEGRDPDYQKLAIKGLIGRAKRTLTLTKAEDKLQNINEALKVFDNWLKDYEKKDLGKQNRSYLPLATIDVLLPLKQRFHIDDEQAESFLGAYKSVNGDYKHLRTVSRGEDEPTWDIVRNAALKELLQKIEEDEEELWKDELPTKEHMNLIVWAYSPDAAKLKKNLAKIEEKLGKNDEDNEESDEEMEEAVAKRRTKRKSSSSKSGSSDDDESPKKKSKS